MLLFLVIKNNNTFEQRPDWKLLKRMLRRHHIVWSGWQQRPIYFSIQIQALEADSHILPRKNIFYYNN